MAKLISRFIFFLVTSFCLCSAIASTPVVINGQTFNLKEISYDQSGAVANARLVGEHTVKLSELNTLELNDNYIWFFPSGKLRWVTSPGALNWKLSENSNITLDCRDRYVGGSRQGRIVSFYENGAYERGCDSISQKVFKSNQYSMNVRYSSILELWADGGLKYASRVSNDSFVRSQDGQIVHLNQHSEVSVFENGQVNFFTIKPGDRLSVNTANAGIVNLATNPQMRIAVQYRENGSLESGGSLEPIMPMINGKRTEILAEAIRFYPNNAVGLMIMLDSVEIPAEYASKVIPLRRGRKALCLSPAGLLIDIQQCQSEFK